MARHRERQRDQRPETHMVAQLRGRGLVMAVDQLPAARIAGKAHPSRRQEAPQGHPRGDRDGHAGGGSGRKRQAAQQERGDCQHGDREGGRRKAPRRHQVKRDGGRGFHR